jgi:hypothetical protein
VATMVAAAIAVGILVVYSESVLADSSLDLPLSSTDSPLLPSDASAETPAASNAIAARRAANIAELSSNARF